MTSPIDPGVILPFLTAVFLIELTPGPNMAYLAALSAANGRAAGFKAVAGVTAGLAIYMLLSIFGVTEIIATAPVVYGVLRWAGVIYLFYLAWEAWRGAEETSPGHAGASADHRPFWRGFVANVLNPKAAIFYITLLPTFIVSDHGAFWMQALILGCVHLLVSIAVHGAIVIGASRAATLIAEAYVGAVRRALAVGVALIAVWLVWETRSA